MPLLIRIAPLLVLAVAISVIISYLTGPDESESTRPVLLATKDIPAGTEIRDGRLLIEPVHLFCAPSKWDEYISSIKPSESGFFAEIPEAERGRIQEREKHAWDQEQRKLAALLASIIGAGSSDGPSPVPVLSSLHAADVVFLRSQSYALEDCFSVCNFDKRFPHEVISTQFGADGKPNYDWLQGRIFRFPLVKRSPLYSGSLYPHSEVERFGRLRSLKKRLETAENITSDELSSVLTLEDDCLSLEAELEAHRLTRSLCIGAIVAACLFVLLGMHRGPIGVMWSTVVTRLQLQSPAVNWLFALCILWSASLIVARPREEFFWHPVFFAAVFVGGRFVGKGMNRGFQMGMAFGTAAGILSVPFLVRTEYAQGTHFFVVGDVLVGGLGGWLGSVLGPRSRPAVGEKK
jgi:hypothetical protein